MNVRFPSLKFCPSPHLEEEMWARDVGYVPYSRIFIMHIYIYNIGL